jgi:chromosome segregation ATPase
MNELNGRLDDLRGEIASLAQTLRSLRAECGARALANPNLSDSKPISALRKEHDRIDAQAAEIAESRGRIDAISARFDELSSQRQSLERERREVTGDLNPLYEQVGEAAFEVYRGNPLIDEECAEIFATAVERTQAIKEFEAELEQLQGETDHATFFDRVRTRGRIAILKNRISSTRSGMRSVFRSAGRGIVETDFIASMGDPKLSAAVEPFREVTAKVHRVNERIASIESEREALSAEMDTLSALGRVRKRLKELSDDEKQLVDKQIEVQARVCEEVEKLLSGDQGETLKKEDLGPIDAVGKTKTKLDELEALQARLRAALDAEVIADQIAAVEKDVARREEQIERLQKEIEVLNSDHAELKKKLAAARKKRGPLSALK